MKNYTKILIFFCLSIASELNGQNLVSPKEIAEQLNEAAEKMESGIYERIIQKGEVDQLLTYNKKHDYEPYLELHYLYLRFAFEDRIDSTYNPDFIVGKVFMSERYVESDYYETFKKRNDYEQNKDGFFYYCKLYYDKKNLDIRLVIYPHYLQNICKKFMHLNTVTCNIGDKLTHETSIKALIRIPEEGFMDVVARNSPKLSVKKVQNWKEFKAFLTKNDVNTNFVGFDDVSNLLKKNIQKSSLNVVVNYGKFMKIFKLIKTETDEQILRLAFSKNENNEDFTYNLQYDYTYVHYDKLQVLNETVNFTRNKDNQNINYSTKPDDKFFAGKKRVFSKISFEEDLAADSCLSSPDYIQCLIGRKQQDTQKLIELEKSVKQIPINMNTLNAKIKKLEELKKPVAYIEKFTKKAYNINYTKIKLYSDWNKYVAGLDILIPDTVINLVNFNVNVFKQKRQEKIEKSINDDYKTYKNLPNSPFSNPNLTQLNIEIDDLLRRKKTFDTCQAQALRGVSIVCTDSLFQTENLKSALETFKINEAKIQPWVDSFKNDSTTYKQIENNIRLLNNNENVNTSALKDYKPNKQNLENSIAKLEIRIEDAKRYKSNSQYFVYADDSLRSYYECAVNYPGKKFAFYNYLFSKPFYVRNNIPKKLTDTTNYEKGRILEIYEPYNYSKKYIRIIFKNERISHISWKKQMRKKLFTLLDSITINDSTSDITINTITDGDEAYYWLKIPPTLKENLCYMNFLFHHRPRMLRRYVRQKHAGDYEFI